MNEEIKILRILAKKYFKIANSEKNSYNIKLHKAVNDLKQIRPVVLIDELPWNEMNINNELICRTTHPYLRKIEWFLRKNIYKNKYMPADMIMPPYIPIKKIIHSTGIGLSVEEEILSTDNKNNIVSHSYKDVLKNKEDLEKIHTPVITYDKQQTMKNYNLVGEILGDIIPVKLTGISYFSVKNWDDIAQYHGVSNVLIDLIERPDFLHRIVKKLTEIKLSYLNQIESMGLLDNDPYNLHKTPIHTDDLPGKDYDGIKITRKDIWGRGAAQIFGAVSKQMHDEFDIQYMKKTVGQCGLVYYGCCEPLDKKIDIVERIPNLRKISISPWADINTAAESINKKYVLSSKPNPSSVSVSVPDKENLKKEIITILDACKKNNCNCDIVLKDISTCCKRPQNIFEWEQIVMDMVKNY